MKELGRWTAASTLTVSMFFWVGKITRAEYTTSAILLFLIACIVYTFVLALIIAYESEH